jgi:hypothetical protein
MILYLGLLALGIGLHLLGVALFLLCLIVGGKKTSTIP